MKLLFGLCCAFLMASAYLFYDQYWQWRSCFNEMGNCFVATDNVVYHEQSGIVWGGVTLALLCLSAILGRKAWGRPR